MSKTRGQGPFTIGNASNLELTLDEISLSLDKATPDGSTAFSLEATTQLAKMPARVAVSYENGSWTIQGILQPDQGIADFKDWLEHQFGCTIPLLDDIHIDLVEMTCTTGTSDATLSFNCTGHADILGRTALYTLDVNKDPDWAFRGTLTVPPLDPSQPPMLFAIDTAQGSHTQFTAHWSDPQGVTLTSLLPSLPPDTPLIADLTIIKADLVYDQQQGYAVDLATNIGTINTTAVFVSLTSAP
ncbi:hypothetical protein [Streptomyces noursei]|uniref:hypothetical protein n=1 Tax=Streptomyces noursei TaxID=1971 RepID=UPI001671C174|nr:hypothetical protein [Streptomyces noursei]MCZ1021275.1 hypothetical protein [Streptomyces noursei]GGX57549.1 hypothetical protein GCM10010341_91870 [Streptomyces noursei]